MNEITKNKFAEILKAAQDKANGQKVTANPAPIVPVIIPETVKDAYLTSSELNKISVADFIKSPNFINDVAADSPELSTMTFADLLSNDTEETKETIAPEPIKPALRLIDYSDKAFAVVGDTKPIKDKLRLLGGSFNSRLSCGMGWIFSKKRLEAVKTELNLSHLVLC